MNRKNIRVPSSVTLNKRRDGNLVCNSGFKARLGNTPQVPSYFWRGKRFFFFFSLHSFWFAKPLKERSNLGVYYQPGLVGWNECLLKHRLKKREAAPAIAWALHPLAGGTQKRRHPDWPRSALDFLTNPQAVAESLWAERGKGAVQFTPDCARSAAGREELQFSASSKTIFGNDCG